MAFISEDDLEQMSLEWFQEIGYTFIHGPLLAPDGETPERDDFRQVVLTGRLRSALTKLNPECQRQPLSRQCFNWRTPIPQVCCHPIVSSTAG